MFVIGYVCHVGGGGGGGNKPFSHSTVLVFQQLGLGAFSPKAKVMGRTFSLFFLLRGVCGGGGGREEGS